MAWYHVNACDCPVGCCDCGGTTTSPIVLRDPLPWPTKKERVALERCNGCDEPRTRCMCAYMNWDDEDEEPT
jgi:hypothetical protein